MTVLDNDLFPTLRTRLTGQLVVRTDGWWDVSRAAWNLAVDQRPSAVVHAETAADVAATVDFAREHGLRVAPQGTGHNAGPLGDLCGTILLKTDRMRGITVDPVARVARVEAGVVWQELIEATAPHGLSGLIGSSPDVGLVGYTLGGGVSWFGRKHGLACSSMVAAEVVTADGVVRHVDAEHDPELFWALRGGGGGFAVVTALELRLQPISTVHAGALLWPMERGADVWLQWREWVESLPDEMTTWARYMQFPPLPDIPEPLRGGSFVVVEACHLGPAAEADALLAPMRQLQPAIDTFATIPTTELTHVHMDPEQPVPAAGDGLMLRDLPEEAVHELVRLGGTGSGSPLLSLEVRHLGGALARSSDGALPALDAPFLVFAVGIAPDSATASALEAYCDLVQESLAPWTADCMYLNFADRSGHAGAFFRPADAARLHGVKQHYDPGDLLRSNHPLVPTNRTSPATPG
jgi:hypothetical protein